MFQVTLATQKQRHKSRTFWRILLVTAGNCHGGLPQAPPSGQWITRDLRSLVVMW